VLNVANTSEETRVVTSQDLHVSHQDDDAETDIVPDHGPNHDDPTQIMKLYKNQRVSIRAIARKGTGKEHAKWVPATVATFRTPKQLTLHADTLAKMPSDQKRTVSASCPRGVFRYDAETAQIEIEDMDRCTACMECVKTVDRLCMGPPSDVAPISVAEQKNIYIFTVASSGALPPEEIVRSALQVLREKMQLASDKLRAVDAPPGLGNV
jgi:DNA-directed RNA polymerase alpha subunit